MANLKISELTDLSTSLAAADELVVVDTDVTTTKRVSCTNFFGNIPTTITQTTTGAGTALTLTSTDADAASGPNLELFRDSSTPADLDALGHIIFFGREETSGDKVEYASIRTNIVDSGDGSIDGALDIFTVLANTDQTRLRFNSANTIFNDDKKDFNFRIETQNHSHMFGIDGGLNYVYITDTDAVAPEFGLLSLLTGGTRTVLSMESTATTNVGGPDFEIYRNSSSPADADVLGSIYFYGEEITSSDKLAYARITATIVSSADGSADGKLEFYAMGGSSAEALQMTIAATTITLGNLVTDVTTVSGDFTIVGDVIRMANIVTADPSSAGQIYSNSGVLTVSA